MSKLFSIVNNIMPQILSSFQSISLRYLDQLIYPATLDDLMKINDTNLKYMYTPKTE